MTFSGDPNRGRGGAASERDDVLGSDSGVPFGGRDAPDRAEDPGAEGEIRERKEDTDT